MKLLAAAFLLPSIAAAGQIVQCVALPYPAMPKQLWERELVWLKNIGATCAALPASPDLPGVLAIARKLELPVWLTDEPAAPESQLESHGGPVRYAGPNATPQPVCRASALSSAALALTRQCLEGRTGTILWTGVESITEPTFHPGAIGLRGEELPALAALRRQIALFSQWGLFLNRVAADEAVSPAVGKLPAAVTARQFFTTDAIPESAVSLINRGPTDATLELRVQYPPLKQSIKLPPVTLPANDALWLPVNLPLAKATGCANCRAFSNDEQIVYATAELLQVDYENGTLSLEFSAPRESEAILHLSSEPAGPYLAAGRPKPIDWDASSGRARLAIPAGTGPTHRVRVALALAEPEISAFFGETKVLLIGQSNTVSTQYSSEAVAARSRLRAPPWLKVTASRKTPNEIDYTFTIPSSALHGSHIELALEADGMQVNHARYQLLRPASLRVREAVSRHYGSSASLPLDPPLIPLDQRSSREIAITIRNNAPEIRTFTVEAIGDGFEFAKPKTEIVVAASSERDIVIRIFADRATPGLHTATLRLTGGGSIETGVRLLVIPRGETVRYSEGLSTILESQRARAVFTADRWLEFVWKDSERNMLPETGIPLGDVHITDLQGAALTTEGGPLPAPLGKQGDVTLSVNAPEPGRFTYTLTR